MGVPYLCGTVPHILDSAAIKELIGAYTMPCKEQQCQLERILPRGHVYTCT